MLDEDTVHLHLEQRVVQRLLGRFRAQGFVHHDLSRACLAQVARRDPARDPARPALALRPRAERLHEELVPVTARWIEPPQRDGPLSAYAREAEAKTPRAARARRSATAAHAQPGEAIAAAAARRRAARRRGAAAAARAARPRSWPASADRASCASAASAKRRDLREILERQRERVREELDRHERRASSSSRSTSTTRSSASSRPNMRSWERRLEQFDRELETRAGAHRATSTRSGRSASSRSASSTSGRRRTDGDGQARPASPRAPRVARLRPADRPRRLAAGARARRRDPRPHATPRASGSCARASRSARSTPRTAESRHRRLPRVRRVACSAGASRRRATPGRPRRPIPPELEVALPDYGETLRPDFAVRELDPADGAPPWQLLVAGARAGRATSTASRAGTAGSRRRRTAAWSGCCARPACRPACSSTARLRLVSAPRGESSGWLDFRVADDDRDGGPADLAALRLLLGEQRLLALPRAQRLAALLDDSRKFQNEVCEQLAEQVLHALYELLRGFQAAHDASEGELLREPLAERPGRGLPRAAHRAPAARLPPLRRGARPAARATRRSCSYYSLAGLFERLREDAALLPDTMDQRYGAWAQLLVLFRLIHDGADAGDDAAARRATATSSTPTASRSSKAAPAAARARSTSGSSRRSSPTARLPRAREPARPRRRAALLPRARRRADRLGLRDDDGLPARDGDGPLGRDQGRRRSTARRRRSTSRSCSRRARGKRAKWLQDRADRKLTDRSQTAVKDAATLEDLHAALAAGDRPRRHARPRAAGRDGAPAERGAAPLGLALHAALAHRADRAHDARADPRAAARRDGRPPRPEQILDLKVCDPAMGSGAFLVEACRQLGDALVEAWHAHGERARRSRPTRTR